MLVKLIYPVSYIWRVFATGMSFVAFGVGGLVISQLIIPLACWTIRDKSKRKLRAQNIIHFGFRFHLELMKRLGIMTTEVIGRERLQIDKAQLLLANHPTLLDVVLMLSLLPRADCIVKQALFRNPFLRGVVTAAGYVNNSSDPQRLIADCVSSVEQGHSLLIFPEGTRSSPGQKMKFQRAPARVAVEGNIDVTPVTITCTPSTLTKDKKWYQIPSHRFHMRLVIGENIKINTIINKDEPPSLSVRKLTRYLENYFAKEILKYEHA